MKKLPKLLKKLSKQNLVIMHSTSSYPCPLEEVNLRMITTLTNEFDYPIGYSGHEVGLIPSVAAVALGACAIERHFTLNRSLWGTDQSASVEVEGFRRLVRYIRAIEKAMGNGIKTVTEEELKCKSSSGINFINMTLVV